MNDLLDRFAHSRAREDAGGVQQIHAAGALIEETSAHWDPRYARAASMNRTAGRSLDSACAPAAPARMNGHAAAAVGNVRRATRRLTPARSSARPPHSSGDVAR